MNHWPSALRSGFVAGLLLTTAASCDRQGPLAKGMNVVLITLDTTRADYVAPFGGAARITPRLLALANRSGVFTNAASETNITNPSHLSIMSGLRAIEHGVLSNHVPVPESVDTLAEAMKREGYRTAAFPAARHLGPEMGWRAFDVMPEVELVVEAEEITDRAVFWLRKGGSAPFFLWVHYFDPHALYEPPPDIAARFYQRDPAAGAGPPIANRDFFRRWKGAAAIGIWLGNTRDPEYARAMYAAEIHYTDREIGRLLDALERVGFAGNTVVVVVADHGESLGEHEIFYAHVGMYEPQLRIPLIVHVPGLPATRSGELVSTLDVAPTISELTGIPLLHEPTGVSMVPLLRGEQSAALEGRQALVHQNAHNHSVAVRQGGWKLIWPINRKHPILSRAPELYHLEEDPGELVDLAESEPQRVQSMRRLLEPWIELGRVRGGTTVHLDSAALEQLRTLGYLVD